ncbi:3-carboxy-cis,cis-muconate cycloisomerase [Nocardia farcinica]|uniref:lyase family protein n=1 Tax=Nocardia farcinica TaxID=37329 RepID=UPI001894D246|nr:lyase family protein [Nocardia farcinica]MBF6422771.1 3-carboxy-cis,cis-muconate cycloisomerase [Nocardia farcinica]MBF6434491.1 3-carboxy-cis,cis-muconate cycloisomerase [Nocardia farcinica]MBF6505576.1 3-carboxy-cis,cis-muconate cycloisomerase [Nocardia farcinica]
MSDLLWPGDHRAGDAFSDAEFLRAMLTVEAAWSTALVTAGIAPPAAELAVDSLAALLTGDDDLETIATEAEAGGNPVIPMIRILRERIGVPQAARWLHRGLTSQDVLDSALMLCARGASNQIAAELSSHAAQLCTLADTYRATPMVGRTLTQYAVPVTVGLKCATWLNGILDARDRLAALRFPVQIGGAAGTMAATVELARGASAYPEQSVIAAIDCATSKLGLHKAPPWHTVRTPVTRCGDAATECAAAFAHIANDVATLSRPEIGELAEGVGGGSSTMPHKANPALSVQIRRTALALPGFAATLHLAAADSLDERSAGAWHTEWSTLRTMLRHALTAARQTTTLLEGLTINRERIAAGFAAAHTAMDSEQQSMAELAGHPADSTYLGLADHFIQTQIDRARHEGRTNI